MSPHESSDVHTSEQVTNITAIVMRQCSATRGIEMPAKTDLHMQVGLQPYESDNKAVSVTLTITSSDQSETDNPNNFSVVIEYLLCTDEEIVNIPEDLAHSLVSIAWPYLRTTLDTLVGMTRMPVLPVPLFPPNLAHDE